MPLGEGPLPARSFPWRVLWEPSVPDTGLCRESTNTDSQAQLQELTTLLILSCCLQHSTKGFGCPEVTCKGSPPPRGKPGKSVVC